MTDNGPLTILCVATYEKGRSFCGVQAAGLHGAAAHDRCARGRTDWPREAIAEFFSIPRDIQRDDLLKGVSHIARSRRRIDRIVPLDDFDVETAALLREHLRVPGMGETTARYFRDKLAMRVRATRPASSCRSSSCCQRRRHRAFLDAVPPPWVLKPRSQAAAIGIRKATTRTRSGRHRGARRQALVLVLEQFVPGDIFHVDSIVWDREVVFSAAHRYGSPPWTVAHEGGVFTTRTVDRHAEEAQALVALNRRVLDTLGPRARRDAHRVHPRQRRRPLLLPRDRGARRRRVHRRRDRGRHRPQPVARVGEARSGWRARPVRGARARATTYAGLVLSLARQEHPDTSAYDDPEIV